MDQNADNENISRDQLEDSLIGTDQVVPAANIDEEFQRKLNERADQIYPGNATDSTRDHSSLQFLQTKTVLHYSYSDCGPLRHELAQWFVSTDFACLGLPQLIHSESTSTLAEVSHLVSDLKASDLESADLTQLTLFALGDCNSASSVEAHLERVTANCTQLLMSETFPQIVSLLIQCFDTYIHRCKKDSLRETSETYATNYLRLLTITYFLVNVAVDAPRPQSALKTLHESKLAEKIVELTESWRISPNAHMRIRNCFLLLWKLILLEFGGTNQLSHVEEYLNLKYDIKPKESTDNLTCSQADYFAFKEDLNDKYPLINRDSERWARPQDDHSDVDSLASSFSELGSLDKSQDFYMATSSFTDSVSNPINCPRTNKTHSVLGNMPMQTVHIATPAPSPPSMNSDFMSGGEKIRKQYHVNQGMPFIYPFEESQPVPEAINEAALLLKNNIHESYTVKRLWKERDLFLSQERGASTENLETLDYSDSDLQRGVIGGFEDAVDSLLRVESFYRNSLPHLKALVEVLVTTMRISAPDFDLKECEEELDPKTSFIARFGASEETKAQVQDSIFKKLERYRCKEVTLKATSAILSLMLKWFKASHCFKSNYLSTLIFDCSYLTEFIDFLGDSFNNSALQNSTTENKGLQAYDILSSQNRLMNPKIEIPHYEFFNYCQDQKQAPTEVNLINKTRLLDFPHDIDENNQRIVNLTSFNDDFCFILVNLLNVTNKVLIKGISQRVLVLNECKPTDLLKVMLINYTNSDLRTPILKIFKKLTPFQGRKWRAQNMDVVSQIYLHSRLQLKDNWLSGKDLENEFNNSIEQEISLRSLLQFYNVRRYPQEMKSLGYSIQNVEALQAFAPQKQTSPEK